MNIEDVKKIREIEVFPIRPANGLVGFASFIYDDSFYLGSIGIYTRPEGGYRLTFPKRKIGGTDMFVFNPINTAIGMLLEELISKKFEEIVIKSMMGD
jgi:hypothetical protein